MRKSTYQMVRSAIYPCCKLLGKVDMQGVRIDGGLGSQIIGYMQYRIREMQHPGISCDVSFFKIPATDPMFKARVTHRNWELGYYGIHLDQFKTTSHRNYWMRKSLKDQGKQLLSFFKEDLKKQKWESIFPIQEITITAMQQQGIMPESEYSVVHLRRGDYLRFASHIVDDEMVLGFIKKVQPLISNQLIIISDDPVSEYFKSGIESLQSNKKIHYLEGAELFLSHAIMRHAHVLITSNSLFSLTAAMLQKEGGVAFFPGRFFGDELPYHNEAIRQLSGWMIRSN